MEDIIDSFPEALFKDASPQSAKVGFHPDTKLACREGKVQGVMAKVVARGDSGVGKTDIIRYMRDVSERDSSTIGIDLLGYRRRRAIQNNHFRLLQRIACNHGCI